MHALFRSATLSTTHLWFTLKAVTVLELNAYSGAALRGSFFNAIWESFCMNKSAPVCAQCSLHAVCPVSALVAPLREDDTWGQDIPRPYVIVPPLQGAKRYQPGEHFSFGMTLIGDIIQLLPYIMLSLSQMEAAGLGHRLEENTGRRGRFQVERVEVYHPWNQQRQTIYEEGSPRVSAPVVSVHIEECLRRAEQLNQREITLHFITPMRLVDYGHLVQQASLLPLVQRLLTRYLALETHYGTASLPFTKEEKDAVRQQAESIVCSVDRTQWQELTSYYYNRSYEGTGDLRREGRRSARRW